MTTTQILERGAQDVDTGASGTAWNVPALARMSLTQAAQMLKTGETTSVALTQACLEAIAQTQPCINAFIRLDAEEALQAAAQADALRQAGQQSSPLLGIPLAHKDVFFRPGKVTTAGSYFLQNTVATQKSAVLENLDRAGAIDLGTLNMAEFCVGPTGQNAFTGHCFNPWNVKHVTGGSSSGSGAAVGARMVFGSIGSDTGGSIRIPAGVCGVTGLKPSYGRISLRGAIERCWTLDVFGPIARSVEDVTLLFDAIDHYDSQDPLSLAARPAERTYPEDWKPTVAVPYAVIDALPEDLARSHHQALKDLAATSVRLISVPTPDVDRLYAATNIINNVEGTWLHQARLRTEPDRFNGSTRSRISRGYSFSGLEYLDAVNGRAVERGIFTNAYLTQADAMYLPLLEIDVPKLSDVCFEDESGADTIVPKMTRWTRFVSYLGLPALSFPVGLSDRHLPIAGQLIGRYFEDRTLLALGERYQKQTGWHLAEPPRIRAEV